MRMIRKCGAYRRRGLTLVETIVSLGIVAFVLSFVAFLIFMGSINAYNVHDQVMAQTSASNASERLTSLLRHASSYSLYPDDMDKDTTATRVLFRMPAMGSSSGIQTMSALCYHAGKRQIQYYENADAVTFGSDILAPVGTPTRTYPHIRMFELMFESDFRLQITLGYEYRGFALVFSNPMVPLIGQFTTDVVAKNHHLSFGPNGYDYEDAYDVSMTSSPIHL